MAKVSIAIPTHDMKDKEMFLRRSLDSIQKQTFTDFEVVVSDNSIDNKLEWVCREYPFKIVYGKNPIKGMAPNTNVAIKNCSGEIIKILYLDDFLYHDRALQETVEAFKGGWLASGCCHHSEDNGYYSPHFAVWSDEIFKGVNTIGSPSVITIENKDPLLFDEKMSWVLDVDYYIRLFKKYGEPTILGSMTVAIGLGDHQMTNILSDKEKQVETNYLLTKLK